MKSQLAQSLSKSLAATLPKNSQSAADLKASSTMKKSSQKQVNEILAISKKVEEPKSTKLKEEAKKAKPSPKAVK